MASVPAAGRGGAWPWLAALAGVLGLAAWTRLARLAEVLHPDAVLPVGGDSAYHFRRSLMTVESFPSVPVLDPLMNWPHGGDCHWGPGWDFLAAALVQLTGQAGDPRAAAVVLAIFPLLGGVLLVALVAGLGKRLGGWTAALAAGIVAATLPVSVAMSRFGRLDHHVGEALAMAALGWWALEGARPRTAPHRRLLHEILGAVVVFAALQVFAGSVVYVAVATVLVIGLALSAERPGWLGGPGLLAAGLLGLDLAVPAVAHHGQPWSYYFPSYLQPSLVLVAAFGCAAASAATALVGRERIGAGVLAGRLAALAGISVLGLGSAALLWPEAADGLLAGVQGFVGRSDPWLAGIDEFQPLLRGDGVGRVKELLGAFGFLAPLTAAGGIVLAIRRDRRLGLAFAVWTVALGLLALNQVRFVRPFVVNLALVTGLCAAAAVVPLARSLRPGAAGPLAAALVLLVVVADPDARATLEARGARDLAPIEEAATWLHQHSDPSEGGVLTPWDHGHFVLWLGEHGVVTTGFGTFLDADGFHEEERAWRGSQDELMAWMAQRDLRWLAGGAYAFLGRVPGPGGAGPFQREASGQGVVVPAYFEALPVAASVVGGSGSATVGFAHLERLWPRFASAEAVGGMPQLPALLLFERVEGAVVTGVTEPGTVVELNLPMRTPQGLLPWSGWTRADDQGQFSLRVPVPTGFEGAGIHTGPTAMLRTGAGLLELSIPEAAVRSGGEVPVLSPAAPSGTASP